MNSLLSIVGEEASYFATLPPKVRVQVVERLAAVAALTNAEQGTKVPTADRRAAQLGVNRGTIYSWQRAYQRKGWRGLIDTRAMPRLVGTRRPSAAVPFR